MGIEGFGFDPSRLDDVRVLLTRNQAELVEQVIDYEIELAEQDDNEGRLEVLRAIREALKDAESVP